MTNTATKCGICIMLHCLLHVYCYSDSRLLQVARRVDTGRIFVPASVEMTRGKSQASEAAPWGSSWQRTWTLQEAVVAVAAGLPEGRGIISASMSAPDHDSTMLAIPPALEPSLTLTGLVCPDHSEQ